RFALTGVRDVRAVSYSGHDGVLVALPNALKFYSNASGTWSLVGTDTEFDPVSLLVPKPNSNGTTFFYATTTDGQIAAYDVTTSGSFTGLPSTTPPASTFMTGLPRSLSVSADGT